MKSIFISIFLAAAALPAHAALMAPCDGMYASIDSNAARAKQRYSHATEILNDKLGEKYSGAIHSIAADPDKFVADIEARFASQKLLTPKNPYQFDFTEVGTPLMVDMNRQLGNKLEQLKKILAETRLKKPNKNVSELTTAISYLEDLQKEARGYLQAGKVNYDQLYKLSFYFSRAYGHFDARHMDLIEKFYLKTDKILNGYKQLSIDKEYEMYKNGTRMVFQNKSPFGGLKTAEPLFSKDAFDPDKLNLIIVPTNANLERDIFMRLLRKKIYFAGVTDEPIRADGILRPSGDFWNHDIRHSAVMYWAHRLYENANHITPAQEKLLSRQIDSWYLEFQDAMNSIKDPKLREAVDLYSFNHHHERGLPIVPSSYRKEKDSKLPYVLYTMMETNKQKNPFTILDMKRAQNWLKAFWAPRAHIEQEILNSH